MKVLWINPSFLDYRVPVYEALNRQLEGNLYVVFSAGPHRTPERVVKKISEKLGDNAIGLHGEKSLKIGKGQSDLANTFLNIPYQPGLLSTILEIDADVIIVEGFFQWAPIGYLKKLLHKTPIVLSYERTFYTERGAGFFRSLYRKFVSRYLIDAAIVNGYLSKEYTASLGISEDKIVTGGMAADSTFFREEAAKLEKDVCKKEWGFNPDTLVFLYVGQIVERKGVMELLNGWKSFDKECLLVCAGDGNKILEAKQFIDDNNIINVNMLGLVEYSHLPSLYKAADIFVIPTLEDNWSLVVPEAMATGLPIACSQYNGCWPELVHDNINGKVFDPLDMEDTLQCLEYFYEHRAEVKKMGEKSIEIEKNYSPENAVQAIFYACKLALLKD